MSHMSKIRCSMKGVDQDLMKRVLQQIAQRTHGTITTTVEDYYGNKTKVNIGINTNKFQRGIGINYKQDGTIEFICDQYQYEQIVQELKNNIIQGYTANSVALALQTLGYQVSAQEINGEVVMSGVKP